MPARASTSSDDHHIPVYRRNAFGSTNWSKVTFILVEDVLATLGLLRFPRGENLIMWKMCKNKDNKDIKFTIVHNNSETHAYIYKLCEV